MLFKDPCQIEKSQRLHFIIEIFDDFILQVVSLSRYWRMAVGGQCYYVVS